MDIIKAAESLLKKEEITQQEFDLVKEAFPGGTGAGAGASESAKKAIGKLIASITPKLSISTKVTKPIMAAPIANALPWLQGGLYAAFGASLLGQLLKPLSEKMKATSSYNKLIEKNPVLAEKDPQQIKDYFNVIETFSPKAASNPLVAGALINKMMEFGGVDHKLVQDLASIQSGLQSSDVMSQVSGVAAKSLFPTSTREIGGGLDIGAGVTRESNLL